MEVNYLGVIPCGVCDDGEATENGLCLQCCEKLIVNKDAKEKPVVRDERLPEVTDEQFITN